MDVKKHEIGKLAALFYKNEQQYTSSLSRYQEMEVRVEFIDPLFRILGWDMDNSLGAPFSRRDVLREESHNAEQSNKKPDYTFRLATKRLFFVEAKRPSVDITTCKKSAFQARSYGFTAGHKIVILTNFRTFRIYNAMVAPHVDDDPDVALLLSLDYKEYGSDHGFDMLYSLLGRDAVANNSFEKYYAQIPQGESPVSKTFLDRINRWRLKIAADLLSRDPDLTVDFLSDVTQKLINRIIFIRMCEDRGIEGEERLRKVAQKKDVVHLRSFFIEMDKRYNTGLFDANQDALRHAHYIDPGVFMSIVDDIYSPNSPYSFGVLDAEFLGQVYDLFLTERLVINQDGSVSLMAKPVYANREIVTTPQDIVHHLVQQSLKDKLVDLNAQWPLTIETLMQLRILDVATGSGRFIIECFNELIANAIEIASESQDADVYLYQFAPGDYRLPFEVKKDLLVNCLYGIDIDYNAVEITRFGLLIKLLEDETGDTLPRSSKILPNLDYNILHGNTLVRMGGPCLELGLDKLTPVISWPHSKHPGGFDLIVGNPPYMKTEEMHLAPEEFEYYKRDYSHIAFRQFDKYFLFIDFAISKLKHNGSMAMLVPNKWMTIESGRRLREHLLAQAPPTRIIDFGSVQLFDGKLTYTCMLFASKLPSEYLDYRVIRDRDDYLTNPAAKGNAIDNLVLRKMGGESWIMPADEKESKLLNKLLTQACKLSDICTIANGIQTSANDVFLIKNFTIHGDCVRFIDKNGDPVEIERAITRPYIDDSQTVRSYEYIHADALAIFPYKMSDQNRPVVIEPDEMRATYPLAMKYLENHHDKLAKRRVAPVPPNGVFYAYGRHQALEVVFTSPKIIYSVNQKGDKYGFDTLGCAYSSGGTAGEVAILNPRQGYDLMFILALLNQDPVEFYARKRGSPFHGGWFARGSAVVSDIPAPLIDHSTNNPRKQAHDRICELTRDLMRLMKKRAGAVGRDFDKWQRDVQVLESGIEKEFNTLWGLD